jgi:hypothetical protein
MHCGNFDVDEILFEGGTWAIPSEAEKRLRNNRSGSPDVRMGFNDFPLPSSTISLAY